MAFEGTLLTSYLRKITQSRPASGMAFHKHAMAREGKALASDSIIPYTSLTWLGLMGAKKPQKVYRAKGFQSLCYGKPLLPFLLHSVFYIHFKDGLCETRAFIHQDKR